VSTPRNISIAQGPLELRVRWLDDDAPYDPGDCDTAETWDYVARYGVYGCVVETRKPACPCCGAKTWENAASLWSIVGDADYHREIERELIAEVAG
jgi:hypothetical protein